MLLFCRLSVPVVHLLFQQLVLLLQLLNGFQLPAGFGLDILLLLCYILRRSYRRPVSGVNIGAFGINELWGSFLRPFLRYSL